MNTQLSFNIESSNISVPLIFEVWIDDQLKCCNNHVGTLQRLECDLPDDENDHVLKFVLKNKQTQHTVVDKQGNIISDAVIKIFNIEFDGIKLGHNILNLAKYHHNFNGTGQQTQDQFYGVMGCNGTVELKFSTPIYIWLLEHM